MSYSRTYIRDYMRKYRKKHRTVLRRQSREAYYRKKAVLSALKDKPCADCGQRYPSCVMDFDHVRGKKSFNIFSGMAHALATLLKEVKKCEVVCANCHRLRTFKRRKLL